MEINLGGTGMYTVMIVEDELLVRMGLMASISWDSFGLRVVAEASNGNEAWALFQQHRPDIVMTDIRIPGMSGLQLMHAVREADPTCALIVITCVEEFVTLKEAMSLGVVGYLVKATMRRQDIVDAAKKARRALEDSGRAEVDSGRAGEIGAMMKAYFLSRTASYETMMRACRVEIPEKLGGFVFVRMSRAGGIAPTLRRSVRNLLSERMARLNPIAMSRDEEGILVLLRSPDAMQPLRALLSGVRRYCQEIFGLDALFCVCVEEAPVRALPDAVQRVAGYSAEDYLYTDAVLAVHADGSVNDPAVNQCLGLLRENLWLLRRGNSVTEIRERMERVESELGSGWAILASAVYYLAQYLAEAARIPDAKSFFQEMQAERKLGTLFSLLTERVVRPALGDRRMRAEVAKAISYMSENLKKDVSLTKLASVVGLHPTYFSRLFKQEMGMNFSDFMTVLRVDRAQELLKTQEMSVQEIADACGFSDVSYFCRKFKSVVGTTPSAWRMR